MKKVMWFLLLTGVSWLQAAAAGERLPAGARSAAMGGASVALQGFWSVFNNPAGMNGLSGPAAGLYADNRFFVRELTGSRVGAVVPAGHASFGIALGWTGTGLYGELEGGLRVALQLARGFSAGVSADYLQVRIAEGYGSGHYATCGFGLAYSGPGGFSAGIHLLNPLSLSPHTVPPARLLPVLCCGLAQNIGGNATVSAEVEKDQEHPLILRVGAELRLAGNAFARVGASTGPAVLTFGCGFAPGKLVIDVSAGYHPALGFSPGLSLVYSFSKSR